MTINARSCSFKSYRDCDSCKIPGGLHTYYEARSINWPYTHFTLSTHTNVPINAYRYFYTPSFWTNGSFSMSSASISSAALSSKISMTATPFFWFSLNPTKGPLSHVLLQYSRLSVFQQPRILKCTC